MRYRAFGVAGVWMLLAAAAVTPAGTSAPARDRLYVTNYASNTLTVFDGSTNELIATVPLGTAPLGALATRDGSRVYVSNYTNCCSTGPGSVSVVDAATLTVTATIPIDDNPTGLALTPTGDKLYVANNVQCPSGCHSAVSVIDTATNTVTRTIAVDPNAWDLVMSPDGNRLYVSNGQIAVDVIDTATDTLVGAIPANAGHLVLGPGGRRLYVATGGCGFGSDCQVPPNQVLVYNTITNDLTATIALSGSPFPIDMARNSSGTRLYVPHLGEPGSLDVVDTIHGTVLATVPLGNTPNGVAVSFDDRRVYVVNSGDSTVSVVDTDTNAIVSSFPSGGSFPWGVITARAPR